MDGAFVRYESRVKHDLVPLALAGDLSAGLFAVGFSFYLGIGWASFLTVPAVVVNALLFWLIYPRGLQLLDGAVRVKTGGLAAVRVPLAEVSEVAVSDGVVHVRGDDGRDLLKPTSLVDPEEFAARVNAAIGRGRQQIAA